MTGHIWLSIALVILIVLIGGVIAGTEFAMMSLRESQLDQLEEQGGRGARVAAIARDPNRFLAAVQIGITLADILSATFGASTLAPQLAPQLERLGLTETAAHYIALIGLTLLLTFFSLVLGELVPKRIALQRASSVAIAAVPILDGFSRLMRPVIWLLSKCTNAIVRLLGADPDARAQEIDDAELRNIIEGQDSMHDDERRILSDVLATGDRTINESMTPRGEVTFLPASLTLADAAELVRGQPYSRYPVIGRDFDDILGFVHVRDVLQPPTGADPNKVRVYAVRRPIPVLPGTARTFATMSLLRSQGTHLAVVVDEYGGTDGIVTLEDLVEEFVGDIRDEYDVPLPVQPSGTYDAGLTIEEFAKQTGVSLPDGPYETVAGYVVTQLGRLAAPGDVVDLPGNGGTLMVREVVGRRVRTVTLNTLGTRTDLGSLTDLGALAAADQVYVQVPDEQQGLVTRLG